MKTHSPWEDRTSARKPGHMVYSGPFMDAVWPDGGTWCGWQISRARQPVGSERQVWRFVPPEGTQLPSGTQWLVMIPTPIPECVVEGDFRDLLNAQRYLTEADWWYTLILNVQHLCESAESVGAPLKMPHPLYLAPIRAVLMADFDNGGPARFAVTPQQDQGSDE